ncbi:MAG: HlyD family efflux transporter periplasmic adaptor subunit [bacterium]|nr:HlyD family efflux transporter periplasmic adaptor subunit [bacterium]
MANQKKVVKFRRPINLNLGVIIFVIMFVYLVIELVKYFSGEQLSVYEVTESQIASDNTYQGLIIRDEKVVTLDKEGYLSYYVSEGKKIGKNSTIYSIDQTGNVYDLLSENEKQEDLTDKDILEIRDCINSYRRTYNGSNYNAVYDYKYSLENTAMELTNINLLSSLAEILKSKDTSGTFEVVKTKTSGSVAYYTDGFESVTVDNFTADMFDSSNYKKTELRSTEKKAAKSDVYKLITNENWNIVIPLSEAQAKVLAERTVVKVTFMQDKLYTNATFKIIQRDNKKYGIISLRNYIQQYLTDRYIDISISTNVQTGYKVPKSAVTEKAFYKIPTSYFTKGGDDDSTGLIQVTTDKDGTKKYKFVETSVIRSDDEYSYVNTSAFKEGHIICNEADNKKQFTIKETGNITGVYNVNKGYPVFKVVDVLTENSDYYIIDMKTTNGLNNYDHIILNVELAKEQHYVD